MKNRRFGHWTLYYAQERIKRAVRQRLRPDDPWLTPDAVSLLNSLLRQGDNGIEWGSGRSTAWIAHRVAGLLSIEHSPEWLEKVQQNLVAAGLQNVRQFLCTTQADYECATRNLEDQTRDFALIDGAFDRGRYALEALRLTRPGGVIIVDDAHRYLPSSSRSPYAIPATGSPLTTEWAEFARATSTWKRIWTSDHVSDTLLLFRDP